MLIAAVAAMVLQQAAGMISWDGPAQPVEAAPAIESRATELPQWALADPFGWERAQCNPVIRKDASLALCQARVRLDLKAALGAGLPAALEPDRIEGCRQVSNGVGGYDLTCAPVERTAALGSTTPAPEVCEDRPTRTAAGAVSFERQCRSASGPVAKDGLSFRLGGQD